MTIPHLASPLRIPVFWSNRQAIAPESERDRSTPHSSPLAPNPPTSSAKRTLVLP